MADLDRIIKALMSPKNVKSEQLPLKEEEMFRICELCRDTFMKQPMMLELNAPLKICGK